MGDRSDDEGEDNVEITTGPPSEENSFLVMLGDEQIKRTIPFMNEVLRQLVTLSAALSGGSMALLGKSPIDQEKTKGSGFVFKRAARVISTGPQTPLAQSGGPPSGLR